MIRITLILIGSVFVVPAIGDDEIVERSSFTSEQLDFFESQIRPLLIEHCYSCHSSDASQLEAGLFVDTRAGLLRGGDSGPVVVVGQPQESLIIRAVKYEASEMPPDGKLEQHEIDALVRWVEMGLPWPQATSTPGIPPTLQMDWSSFDWETAKQSHWAWQPVRRPTLPLPNTHAAAPTTAVHPAVHPIDHPIDQFIASRRAPAELVSQPTASSNVLVRRIYHDLLGIPPTPQQVQAFASAALIDRPQAVELLIDELLQSPLYGQRWARHWLDVARYSDGHGGFLDSKALEHAWRYRDWVVDAFNEDLPVDDFLRLQIAGDLIGSPADAVATGFFALGPTYQSDGGDPESIAQSHGETLDDRVDLLTRGLLGITGSCARCHDHKFDPIPSEDYYSLAGVFNNTSVHDLSLSEDPVIQRANEHRQLMEQLRGNLERIAKTLKDESRAPAPEEQVQLDEWQRNLDELHSNPPPAIEYAHALHDTGSDDMKVALRGNLLRTGNVAPRRFLRLLSNGATADFVNGSGRVALAAAIVAAENPLTGRVFVNRVWQHHFGVGLVRTPSNFGVLGEPPTHPELLDWLTSEFIAKGWSMKQLHRLIMTSETYQLSSDYDSNSFMIDSDNRMYWRMNPRRMDVEAWRDSLLSVTGELDTTRGGPSLVNLTDSPRRTLYAKVSRNGDVFESDSFLRRFDFPLMRATVEQRAESIVPQQFLFLLNSRFMIERAKALAARLRQTSDSDQERIELAYQLLFARSPSLEEQEIGLQFVSRSVSASELTMWERYAQVLLSSNEFMFVR